jgi:hypothetical protein
VPSTSAASVKGRPYFSLNRLWLSTLSRETPITTASLFEKFGKESRKPQDSVVQPGVSSFG